MELVVSMFLDPFVFKGFGRFCICKSSGLSVVLFETFQGVSCHPISFGVIGNDFAMFGQSQRVRKKSGNSPDKSSDAASYKETGN